MGTLDTRDRFVWLACGLLLLAWVIIFIVYFDLYDAIWAAAASFQKDPMSQNGPRVLVAALSLAIGTLAWLFYSMGAGELRKQAELERRFRRSLQVAYRGTLHALTSALDLRDDETYGHCRRVMGYSLAIGRRLDLDPQTLQTLAWGALIHDLGKIGIRDEVLLKPASLSSIDWDEMCHHVVIGAEVVRNIPFLLPTADLILHHHERFDGEGYPDHLAGEDIPLLARIFTVADAFDAMTSPRPYRVVPLTTQKARTVIQEESGRQFCPVVAQVFLDISQNELIQIKVDSLRLVEDWSGLVHMEDDLEKILGSA